MPRPHSPEFRKRAVELARLREKPIAQIAVDRHVRVLPPQLAAPGRCRRRRQGTVRAGPPSPGAPGNGHGDQDPGAGLGALRTGERSPKIVFWLVHELSCDGIDVTVACRVLEVSRSDCYDWLSRPPSERDWDDAHPRRDPVGACRLPSHLWRPEGPCRAQARTGPPGWPQAGGSVDRHCWPATHLHR